MLNSSEEWDNRNVLKDHNKKLIFLAASFIIWKQQIMSTGTRTPCAYKANYRLDPKQKKNISNFFVIFNTKLHITIL